MSWLETILHVDMDAFFVEVERLRSPELRGQPVAVGGDGPRGVVASASYEARKHGVHSAMPMSRARRRCPHLVVVAPDHGRYREVSEYVFEVFRSFTPWVEGLSLDEAFLDVRGLRRHFQSPFEIAEAIRHELRQSLDLPASVGIASNKFLAKLASGRAKPDGVCQVAAANQLDFLHALGVRSLWGVGEATYAALEQLGVETVGDIARLPPSILERRLGSAVGRHLAELAAGRDARPVEPDVEAKSVSVEHTYSTDLSGGSVVRAELLVHADALASRLRRGGLAARTITLKVRYSDFTTATRSETADPTDVTRQIHHRALRLAGRVDLDRPVRLLGLGGSGLVRSDGPRQLEVDGTEDWRRLAAAVEGVRRRFGDSAVEPATLLERRGDR